MQVLVSILGLAVAIGLTGFLYQSIGAYYDRRRYAGSGRWVEIDHGCQLYLLEKGSGGPTVLFEAGIAATNLNWCHIQETVSEFASTASYDRSGLGWSSPCRTARTPSNIAAELHALLQGAGMKPPYILVGHSFGGLVVRRYALLHPGEVAGVLLVDPMRCEEWPPLDPSKQSQLDRGTKLSRFAVPFGARLRATGKRGWERRPACAEPGDGRGGQDAQGSLADCRGPLVPTLLLCGHAQPCGGRSRDGAGDARRRTHSRHSGDGADTREVDAAFERATWPHWRQRAADYRRRQRALDSPG